jgi:hypothetical protein
MDTDVESICQQFLFLFLNSPHPFDVVCAELPKLVRQCKGPACRPILNVQYFGQFTSMVAAAVGADSM